MPGTEGGHRPRIFAKDSTWLPDFAWSDVAFAKIAQHIFGVSHSSMIRRSFQLTSSHASSSAVEESPFSFMGWGGVPPSVRGLSAAHAWNHHARLGTRSFRSGTSRATTQAGSSFSRPLKAGQLRSSANCLYLDLGHEEGQALASIQWRGA